MSKKRTLMLTFLAPLTLISPAAAEYESTNFSAHLCRGSTPSDESYIVTNSFGVNNSDYNAMHTFYCGNLWQANTILVADTVSAQVQYNDRSNVDGLRCRIELRDATSGTVYSGPEAHSCSSAGGCTSASPSHVNTGAPDYLNMHVDHPTIGPDAFGIRCVLPRRSTTYGWSGIGEYDFSADYSGF